MCRTDAGETAPLVYDRYGYLDGSISEQGYHGLKKCVYNFELCLPESGRAEYEAYAEMDTEEKIIFEIYGEVPDVLTLDGTDVFSAQEPLTAFSRKTQDPTCFQRQSARLWRMFCRK